MSLPPPWRNLLAALALLLWAMSAHLASAGIGATDLHVLVAVAPLYLAAVLLAGPRRRRAIWLAALTLLSAWLLLYAWPWLRGHLPWLYYLQHLGVHLALAAWFARSLLRGREPVVSAMARWIHAAPPSPRALRYTRGVTWAWALFFVGNALVSSALFAWAPIEIWSLHANLLTGPLVAAFFGLELLVRRHCLARAERPSIADVVRAWRAQTRPHSAVKRSSE